VDRIAPKFAVCPANSPIVRTLCEGEQLRAIAVYEHDGEIGIADFRVTACY
jgi:hypothetical protein